MSETTPTSNAIPLGNMIRPFRPNITNRITNQGQAAVRTDTKRPTALRNCYENRGAGASKTCLTQGDEPPKVLLERDGLLPVIAIFMVSHSFDKAIRKSGFCRNDADELAVACSRV